MEVRLSNMVAAKGESEWTLSEVERSIERTVY